MIKAKNILGGLLGGVIGGAVVDLIFINFAGPSALFSLIGIIDRVEVFGAHIVLGGILGIIFVLILNLFSKINIWLAGELWGLLCMATIGGIPAQFYYPSFPSFKIIVFGILVWSLFGFIIVVTLKLFKIRIAK
jgi:uncharacterized membrane protein YagU involved in acid resistance